MNPSGKMIRSVFGSGATGFGGGAASSPRPPRIDPATGPTARLELAVDRLRSDNPLFERELQRRVDARRHPRIIGELRGLHELGPPGSYTAEGDLTFHGVTRRVAGELRLLVEGDGAIQLEGEQVFDIRDFGIDPPKLLLLKADPEVKVRVRLAARREGSPPGPPGGPRPSP